MKAYRHQRGITVTAVLGIMVVVTILALAFMGMVRFQIKDTAFEQATITSAYVAEMGFQQIRAELAEVNGEWSLLNGVVKDCETTDPFYDRCQRIPASSSFADFRVVRENPLDPNSPVIGIYEAAIETGQKRAIFDNKTLTGSEQGFVSGSSETSEQIGYDVHGNRLCDQSDPDQTCPGSFLGVRVKAWLTDAEGALIPNTRSQTIYGVLQMDSRNPNDLGPSGFMLESNDDIVVVANSEWNGSQGQFVPQGGFYGPMHTNGGYTFEWDSSANDDATPTNVDIVQRRTFHSGRFNASNFINYRDELGAFRPFWGILMAHRNNISAGNNDYDDLCTPSLLNPPKIYHPGANFQHLPFFKIAEIKWVNNPQPAVGTTYDVVFRRTRDGAEQSISVVRGHLGATPSDIAENPFNVPFEHAGIVEIHQGGTVFPPASVNVWVNGSTDWVYFDGSNWVLTTGTSKPTDNYHYCMRYIDHSTINIHEKMTYSGAAPNFRYWHEHPAGESVISWNQAAHGHGDVVGAQMGVNSVSGDPGYDTNSWRHSHYITNTSEMFDPDLTDGTGASIPNTYLKLANSAYAPSVLAEHVTPLLGPSADIGQYKNQMEQLNKYLVLTLGVSLPRDSSDVIDASQLASAPFNASNYQHGYLVGKFPSDASFGAVLTNKLPSSLQGSPPFVDFRSVYFGNDLRYSAGSNSGDRVLPENSAYDLTAWIWVNDTASSANYMKVASTQLDTNYRRYLYRQIPPGKVILARDAVVLLGNMRPQTGNCEFLKASCLDFHPGFVAEEPGYATIVDGQLTILSFTTTPPASGQEHLYNRGDIVVTGNVLYHNEFHADPANKTQMRQLATQPVSPFIRSRVVNGPISDINDSQVMWVTNTNGTRARNSSGGMVGTLDGLGLFATHDVKLSVTGYFNTQAYEKNMANPGQTLVVQGQLIAGHKITVHGDDRIGSTGLPLANLNYHSKIDKLEIYGTVYSYASPNFSSYFRLRREYYFDRSLQMNPLIGAPYYPDSVDGYRYQTVFSQFPKLVQGTWVQSLN